MGVGAAPLPCLQGLPTGACENRGERGGHLWFGPGSRAPLRTACLTQILDRYDVALVQEVRDSDLSAVTELLERLNR